MPTEATRPHRVAEWRNPRTSLLLLSFLLWQIFGLRVLKQVLRTSLLTIVTLHVTVKEMIRTFRHDGIEKFFRTGSKAGIQPAHAKKLTILLATLNRAIEPATMDVPGWGFHPLKGDLAGHWSVKVNGNWRITFRFEGEDAILVDYRDYH